MSNPTAAAIEWMAHLKHLLELKEEDRKSWEAFRDAMAESFEGKSVPNIDEIHRRRQDASVALTQGLYEAIVRTYIAYEGD